MSSNEQPNCDLSLQDYHCPACGHLLKDPVQMACVHRHCCSCLNSTRTETNECRTCQVPSVCSQVFADQELKQRVETLNIHCQRCQPLECLKARQAFPQDSNQSETSLIAGNMSTNLIPCPLWDVGCRKQFLSDKRHDHYISDAHLTDLQSAISTLHVNYHCALDDSKMNPRDLNESSTENGPLKIYPKIVEDLTNQLSNAMSSMNLKSSSAAASADFQLHSERMDRDPNFPSNLQSRAILNQRSKNRMDELSDVITPQFASTDVQPMFYDRSISQISNTCRMDVDLDAVSKPGLVGKGILIWNIPDITEKIGNAVACPESRVESPPFLTPIPEQRVWVRLYLNGRKGSKNIAIHVHLNSPQRDGFHGEVKFTLVDQSQNQPFSHIVQQCSGKITNVGDSLGFDNFTDKNYLQCACSRYVADDSICIIVQLRPEGKNDFGNIPINIRDVLMAK